MPKAWKAGDQRLPHWVGQDLERRGRKGEDADFLQLEHELLVSHVMYYISSVTFRLDYCFMRILVEFRVGLWRHMYWLCRKLAREQRVKGRHPAVTFSVQFACFFQRSFSVLNMLPGVCAKCCPQHTLTFVISGGPMQSVLSNQRNIWLSEGTGRSRRWGRERTTIRKRERQDLFSHVCLQKPRAVYIFLHTALCQLSTNLWNLSYFLIQCITNPLMSLYVNSVQLPWYLKDMKVYNLTYI